MKRRLFEKQLRMYNLFFAKPATVNNKFQAKISNAYHKTACVELKNRNGGKNTTITVNLFLHGTFQLL